MQLQYRNLWLVLGWLLVIVIIYLSLSPKPPDIDLGFDWQDKPKHLLAYFTLMAWFSQLYQRKLTRLSYALGFVMLGVGLEYLQGLSRVRMFDYDDMLANALGVLVAWFAVRGKFEQLLLVFEKRFLVRH